MRRMCLAEAKRAADRYLRQCARQAPSPDERIAPPAWLAAGAAPQARPWRSPSQAFE
jgi:hypothetical protein